jgi:hypothetical protein
MMELSPQGISPPPFKEKLYPVNRNVLVVISVGALAAPLTPRHGPPPDMVGISEESETVGSKSVHHVSERMSTMCPN